MKLFFETYYITSMKTIANALQEGNKLVISFRPEYAYIALKTLTRYEEFPTVRYSVAQNFLEKYKDHLDREDGEVSYRFYYTWKD